jgi:predicted unusual protein kinase regulating ubiquinone biosynthesis (AarF/ABC1/UbiB family)
MSEAADKHDQFLKKVNLWVAVLAGLTTLIVGAYNVKNIFFTKKKPEPVKVERTSSGALREAVEEVGASWIKELAAKNK